MNRRGGQARGDDKGFHERLDLEFAADFTEPLVLSTWPPK